MPQPKKGPRLGSGPAHQRLMLSNLAVSLFEHERITTTEAKAKMLRPFAEKLITKAKRGDVHNRRQVLATIEDRNVVHKLFDEIAPRFADRNGGYTRILKLEPRNGDGAPMALVELLDTDLAVTVGAEETSTSRRGRRARRPAAEGTEVSDELELEAEADAEDEDDEALEAEEADEALESDEDAEALEAEEADEALESDEDAEMPAATADEVEATAAEAEDATPVAEAEAEAEEADAEAEEADAEAPKGDG